MGVHAVVIVKKVEQLDEIDGIIIPGGSLLLLKNCLSFSGFYTLRQKIVDGLPVFGTRAGIVMLFEGILDGNVSQERLTSDEYNC